MVSFTDPATFLKQSANIPVVDVRAPVEYLQGHIPGAVNIPLFDDRERALVGTAYQQSGHESAILLGLDIAIPKTSLYIDLLRQSTNTGKILLHCWRGGMRSASMARVFDQAGWEVNVLSGGYKSYRQFIRHQFSKEARIVVLGGFTGIGKTKILESLAKQGEQVIDLEKQACHKGSVFGSFGQPPQPTNEQFENDLYSIWSVLDFTQPIWLEDESRMIGKVTLPDPVYNHMLNGVLIRLEVDLSFRVDCLIREYAHFDKVMLADAITKLKQRLGGARTSMAIKALENDRFAEVVEIILEYYDQAYQFSIARRKNKLIYPVNISGMETETAASYLLGYLKNQIGYASDLPRL